MICPNCGSDNVVVSNRYNRGIYWPRQLFFLMRRCRVCHERFATRGLLFGGSPRAGAAGERNAAEPPAREKELDEVGARPEGLSAEHPQPSGDAVADIQMLDAPTEGEGQETNQRLTSVEEISEEPVSEESVSEESVSGASDAQNGLEREMEPLQAALAQELSRLQLASTALEAQRGEYEQLKSAMNADRAELQQILQTLQEERIAVGRLKEALQQERIAGCEAAESLQRLGRELEQLRALLGDKLNHLQEVAPSSHDSGAQFADRREPARINREIEKNHLAQRTKSKRRSSRKLRFQCPHCSQRLSVAVASAGKTGVCKFCHQKVPIPAG